VGCPVAFFRFWEDAGLTLATSDLSRLFSNAGKPVKSAGKKLRKILHELPPPNPGKYSLTKQYMPSIPVNVCLGSSKWRSA